MNPTTHRISRERTKVIVVAMPDTPAGAAAIAAVKDAYRTQFHQQSVGTIVQPVCARVLIFPTGFAALTHPTRLRA